MRLIAQMSAGELAGRAAFVARARRQGPFRRLAVARWRPLVSPFTHYFLWLADNSANFEWHGHLDGSDRFIVDGLGLKLVAYHQGRDVLEGTLDSVSDDVLLAYHWVDGYEYGTCGSTECMVTLAFSVALPFAVSRIAPVVAGSITPSSRLVPGGGLAAHEAAGGHTLLRHLGKSDAELVARVQAQPRITGASTWNSRAIAEGSIAEVLSTNAGQVRSWLSGSSQKLVLNGRAADTVGRYVAQRSINVQNVSGIRVVLIRDPSMGTGFRIQTAFPTP